MKFKTSDQIELDYDDVGTGQPVLIMTGYAGYREIWRAQVETLVSHGYRVINLDRRNHGRSETTTKGLRMSRQGKDVAELLDYLHLDHVDVMGNSMGAATIWAYCSLYGDRRLHKVISVDQSPKMISDETWSDGLLDLTWANFPTEASAMIRVHTTFKRIDDETYRVIKDVQAGKTFDYQLNQPLLYDHAFQDWRDVIRQLSVPVLFMAGAESPFWNPEHAQKSAALCPKGQFWIAPEAGHIIMAEQQAAFNDQMLMFLADE